MSNCIVIGLVGNPAFETDTVLYFSIYLFVGLQLSTGTLVKVSVALLISLRSKMMALL